MYCSLQKVCFFKSSVANTTTLIKDKINVILLKSLKIKSVFMKKNSAAFYSRIASPPFLRPLWLYSNPLSGAFLRLEVKNNASVKFL